MLIFLGLTWKTSQEDKTNRQDKYLEGLVIGKYEGYSYLMSESNIIYKLNQDLELGNFVRLIYAGEVDYLKKEQNINIKNIEFLDKEFVLDTIFNNYLESAREVVKNMSLEEKIGQIFMVHHSSSSLEDVKDLNLGGFVFFGADFKDKTKKEVKEMFKELQDRSKIPLYIAVDEEGGSVVRISSNTNLVDKRFLSPQELYKIGGFEKIREDNIYKNSVLEDLGININLAPVVDMSSDKDSYIYKRTIGLDKEKTANFAQVIIESSKESKISNTLKHYPGYSNNLDTHKSDSSDLRTVDDLLSNDLVPFKAGVDAGAESVMVSHNILSSIDDMPTSLSFVLHNILRENLSFRGIVITDALNMGALKEVNDIAIKAVLSGNDILVTKNYRSDINSIKEAISNKNVSEKLIDILALKNIMWKMSKGLM